MERPQGFVGCTGPDPGVLEVALCGMGLKL